LSAFFKPITVLFLILFLSFSAVLISAQEISSSGIPDTGNTENTSDEEGPIEINPVSMLADPNANIRFLQRLTWEKAQFAVRYSALLERRNEELDTWVEVLRRNMDADITYIDVSVPAGDYRYRVYSFNVLGQLDTQTDWEYFTVLKAIQPSVLTFTPEAFYFDRATSRIINITGESLFPETLIYLEGINLFDEDGEILILNPVELHLNELGETARVIFSEDDLVAGKYNIVARSPGGLESRLGTFSISMAKPYDINVAIGYTPNLTLYGMKDYFLDRVFVPASFSVRASFIPFKHDFGYLGAEISPGWTLLVSEKDGKKSTAQMILVKFNGLYQYNLVPQKLFLNGRAGFGIAGIFNYHFTYNTGKTSESMSAAAFALNLGASVQWFVRGQIYVEGGFDYISLFHSEIPMGFIRIGLFGGYQF